MVLMFASRVNARFLAASDEIVKKRIVVKPSEGRLRPALRNALHRGALGVAGTPKQLAIQRAEVPVCRKEPETGTIAHDDSCGFRTDFDDVGIRHVQLALFGPGGRANNGRRPKTFPTNRSQS